MINHLVPHPTVVQWHNIYKDVCGKSESPLLLTLLQRLCVTRATAKQDKHTATEGRGGRGTRHSQAGPSEVKLTFSLLINQREVKQAHFAINKRLTCLDELLSRPTDRRGQAHQGPSQELIRAHTRVRRRNWMGGTRWDYPRVRDSLQLQYALLLCVLPSDTSLDSRGRVTLMGRSKLRPHRPES